MDELVDDLLLAMRVQRERAPIFPPTVVWQSGDLDEPVITTIADPTGDVQHDLDAVFTSLKTFAGDPVWFAVTLDAYARANTPDRPVAPGGLEAAFRDGDPNVYEQLVTIHVIPSDGALTMHRQVYRHTPADGWEWDFPELINNPDNDEVVTAVRMFH